jgi:hypothetical protein
MLAARATADWRGHVILRETQNENDCIFCVKSSKERKNLDLLRGKTLNAIDCIKSYSSPAPCLCIEPATPDFILQNHTRHLKGTYD